MGALQLVTALLRQLLQSRAALVAENLALRQQVAALQRSVKRPRLHRRNRIFWIELPHPHLLPGSPPASTDRRSLQRHKSSDGALAGLRRRLQAEMTLLTGTASVRLARPLIILVQAISTVRRSR